MGVQRVWTFLLLLLSVAVADLRLQTSIPFETDASPAEVAANRMDFLIIVGDVSTDMARVLYEPLVTGATIDIVLEAATADGRFERVAAQSRAHTQPMPYVKTFDGLVPHRQHRVRFALNGHDVAEAMFRTAPTPSDATDVRVLSVSCDRFSEDADDTHWSTLAADIASDDSYFGIVHTGDQIYADQLVDLAVAQIKAASALSFEETLSAFRDLYRRCFGRPMLQYVLRRGAHWMLIDDHDIINNWSYANLESPQHEVLVRAGLQAFYEYQFQLLHDVNWQEMDFAQTHNWSSLYLPGHALRRIGNLSLLLVDTRLDRGLQTTAAAPTLMSDHQLRFVQETLDAKVDGERLVLFTPLPLFFHTKYSAAFADLVDGEMYPGLDVYRPFFRQLWPHLAHASLLVGGDLHMTADTTVCGHVGSGNWSCLPQLITSGMTQASTTMDQLKIISFHFAITQVLQPFHWLYAALVPRTRTEFAMLSKHVYYGKNYGYVRLAANHTLSYGAVAQPYTTGGATLVQMASDMLSWAVHNAALSSALCLASYLAYARLHSQSP
ncbi:hypothetical protein SDRG_04901 [Saprolegnia diclina VS20]|uniref:PhoD-like phosphatase metallophosphatase domain-containing protein n=1 Tax=Saprolegnia diclina (strain VS20) TaxID=1156394 RepID=T0QV27_SAPDV|nr:hypothetical protein SDRG_04901 [Saprolegnia diclina VS20]EQC37880.1 hypothetical protein SDRG_04901 [Saprolegnia diclina VS20]|eukprot:XP_008608813.1 hypothetical protein SDRG_04901 [Saprolegnia diclina VS20]